MRPPMWGGRSRPAADLLAGGRRTGVFAAVQGHQRCRRDYLSYVHTQFLPFELLHFPPYSFRISGQSGFPFSQNACTVFTSFCISAGDELAISDCAAVFNFGR